MLPVNCKYIHWIRYLNMLCSMYDYSSHYFQTIGHIAHTTHGDPIYCILFVCENVAVAYI